VQRALPLTDGASHPQLAHLHVLYQQRLHPCCHSQLLHLHLLRRPPYLLGVAEATAATVAAATMAATGKQQERHGLHPPHLLPARPAVPARQAARVQEAQAQTSPTAAANPQQQRLRMPMPAPPPLLPR